MIPLYHTSNQEVSQPDLLHSRQHLDFGRGFYLTPIYEQAKKYGERFLRKGEEAYINVYELDEDLTGFTKKYLSNTTINGWILLLLAEKDMTILTMIL